jgi:hypothetical protein
MKRRVFLTVEYEVDKDVKVDVLQRLLLRAAARATAYTILPGKAKLISVVGEENGKPSFTVPVTDECDETRPPIEMDVKVEPYGIAVHGSVAGRPLGSAFLDYFDNHLHVRAFNAENDEPQNSFCVCTDVQGAANAPPSPETPG